MKRSLGMVVALCLTTAAPQQPAPLRIVVNIPAYRLDVYRADSIIRTMPVAVGMRKYETPRGEFAITRIEWNPWWIPPDRPWAAREHVTPPGPDNPMGRVKLYFRPLYFIHGTPFDKSIGSAASHGCIRMSNANALELAQLVSAIAGGMTPADIDRLTSDDSTRTIELRDSVRTEVRYDLAELRRDSVFVYPDVYSLASRSIRELVYGVLAEHGIDSSRVDSTQVALLTRRLGGKARGVPWRVLLRPGVSATLISTPKAASSLPAAVGATGAADKAFDSCW